MWTVSSRKHTEEDDVATVSQSLGQMVWTGTCPPTLRETPSALSAKSDKKKNKPQSMGLKLSILHMNHDCLCLEGNLT